MSVLVRNLPANILLDARWLLVAISWFYRIVYYDSGGPILMLETIFINSIFRDILGHNRLATSITEYESNFAGF
jgi:hypothetical protein